MPTSARSASLLARRTKSYSGYKVLTPVDKSISTIQKNVVKAEFDSMISKYNAGQVGNEEMRSFLQKSLSNPILTPQEKVDIQTQISDFDNRVNQDKLEAVYKAAPQNTLEQTQAAQALSNFFKKKATNMQVDTPAYSQAMQAAAGYDQKIVDINSSMVKTQRATQRATLFNEVAKSQPTNLEEMKMKAEAYQTLANQARADGDTTTALQLETYGQNELNKIPAEQDRLAKQEQAGYKKEIVDQMNLWANDYHDGKIDETQYLNNLSQLQPTVDSLGDTALLLSFNRTTDTIAKNLEKGGLNRSTAGGLPVVLGTQGKGVAKTDWDQKDFDYSDDLRLAYEMFKTGKWDGQKYSDILGQLSTSRDQELETRYNTLYEVAKENPNTKIYYNGSKQRVENILTEIQKEQDGFQGQIQAIQQGTSAVMEVPPDQFNQSGTLKKSGKSIATYQVVDTNNLPEGVVQDSQGILHQIEQSKVPISYDEYSMNQFNDPAKYSQDKKTGQYFRLEDNPKLTLYEPGTSNKITVDYNKDQPVPDYQTAIKARSEKFNPIVTQMLASGEVPKPQTEDQRTYYGVDEKGNKIIDTQAAGPNKTPIQTQGVEMPKTITQPPMSVPYTNALDFSKSIANAPKTIQPVQPAPAPMSIPYDYSQAVSKPFDYSQAVSKPAVTPTPYVAPKSQPVQQPQKNWWDEPVKKVQNVVSGIGTKIKNLFGW